MHVNIIFHISKFCDYGTINKLAILNKNINKRLQPYLDVAKTLDAHLYAHLYAHIDEHSFERYISWNIKNREDAFTYACKIGHLEIAESLFSKDININKQIYLICKRGHLKVLKWACTLSGANIRYNDDYYMRIACEYNQLEVAKWLRSKGLDIHYDNNCCMIIACRNGYIEIADWIYELGGIDIHDKHYSVPACIYGQLEIIKWLTSKGVIMDIECIKWSCYAGQIDILKWMHSAGIDILAVSKICLKMLCKNGYLEAAKWIVSLGGADTNSIKKNIKKYYIEIQQWIKTLK